MAAMMLSSYTTLLSRAPAPAPVPGKSSPAAAQRLCSRRPAAESVAALRWASSSKEPRSRAAPFTRHAANKYSYNIEPTALVYRPTTPAAATENWSVTEDKEKDLITLKLNVGDLTSKELVVSTMDHMLLLIRYKGDINDDRPASSLNVRLLMPPGYDDEKVKAIMVSEGSLIINIPKPKHKPFEIPILLPSPAPAPAPAPASTENQ